MQTASILKTRPSPWQEELARSFRDIDPLLDYLQLDKGQRQPKPAAGIQFPFRVTPAFARKMRKGDMNDPLLRQVLPLTEEMKDQPGFSQNPVGDLEARATRGVLHKYYNRILLLETGACAINCRYCFRRNFPYSENQLGQASRKKAIAYLKSRPEVREIIISGGDPLMTANSGLSELVESISRIDHVERLRIHTRIPTVLPSRIDGELVRIMSRSRLKTVIVAHINHPNEIDQEVENALKPLLEAGIRMFNQAVLLKGINDSPEVLRELLETTFDIGINPYYLHMLDRATGTAHFEVTKEKALFLQEELRKNLPGYLLPRFVREIPGEPYKTPL